MAFTDLNSMLLLTPPTPVRRKKGAYRHISGLKPGIVWRPRSQAVSVDIVCWPTRHLYPVQAYKKRIKSMLFAYLKDVWW